MADAATIRLIEACQALAQVHTTPSGPPWWWSALAAPAATALFGAAVAWIAIAFERRKTINQELIKKRIAIYDGMAPKLNALFCFFLTVGRWKEFTPTEMIRHKRDLDHDFHIYRPLFSQSLGDAYLAFIDACFEIYTGSGNPARLRARLERMHREWGAAWDPAWDSQIAAPERASNNRTIRDQYLALMAQFAVEMGVRSPSRTIRLGLDGHLW